MSNSSEMEENIEEEITEEVYAIDDDLREEVDIRGDIAGSLTESEASVLDDAVKPEEAKMPMEVIDKFSGALAKIVVEEAMLINEIHEKDKLNVTDEQRIDKASLPRNGSVANGKLEGTSDTSGYDAYLMQKLLRSEADPNEATIVENFEDRQTSDERYPGLDPADRYVKEEVERGYVETNDQNNNQVADSRPPSEGVGDIVLQTIHEDSELQIKSPQEVRHSTPVADWEQPEAVVENENEAEKQHDEETEHEKSIKFAADTDGQETMASGWTYGHTVTGEKTDSVSSSDEETDDEEECCEMTYKEKKAIVLAVRDGDIDLVEELLEKRHAHIDMLWFGETLLMVAIRMLQQQMAEFLVDNDIELEYESRIVEKDEDGDVTIHKVTARQMAFDRGLEDLVELIDYKTNNLFDFIIPKERDIRIRRPRPPTPPTPEVYSDDDLSHDPEEEDGGKTERSTLGEKDDTGRKKSARDSDSGINQRKGEDKDTEKSMSTYSDESSVHSSEAKQKSLSHKTKSHSGSRDDLSQVFGPDEGYETMSPISPVGAPAYHRLEHNVVGTKEYVSIRGTKASHLLRAHTASKRTVSAEVSKDNGHVGSYGFESRKWNFCKSAPPPKNYSLESIPDSVVRYGLPFIHGSGRNVSRSADENKRTHKSRNSRRSSPYDEVVKVLSDSRLLSQTSKSIFPSLPEKSTVFRENHPRNLNINYIYANRGSANSTRNVPTLSSMNFTRQNTDLLPKRKLKI